MAICSILDSISAIFVCNWYDEYASLSSLHLRSCTLPGSNEVGRADTDLIQISNGHWEGALQTPESLDSSHHSASFQPLKRHLLPAPGGTSVVEHMGP